MTEQALCGYCGQHPTVWSLGAACCDAGSLAREVQRLKDENARLRGENPNAPNEPGANTFIQWKGTDVCMDITCPKCDDHGHIDGDFVYAAECLGCGTVWKLGQAVSLIETRKEDWSGCEPWPFGGKASPTV